MKEMMRIVLGPALLFAALSPPASARDRRKPTDDVKPPPPELVKRLKLSPFYKKYVDAKGFPILSSAKPSDYALLEARYLVNLMLAKRPDVRKAMIAGGSRMVVMAHNEWVTDVPEYSELSPKDFWDRRARGLGGSRTDPVCSCAEENLLAYRGDPYATECILIHEFAHNIHLRGMVKVDPAFDDRLRKTYKLAMAKGLWKGKYAAQNKHEYFAEGVQSWFDNNRPPDHDHNHVDTRVELRAYDPALAALCEEVFGDTELKYTKPATRLRGHLAGYDPAKAPRFEWPKRLKQKPGAIRHIMRKLEGWTLQVDRRMLSGPHEAEGAEALRILGDKLHEIARSVPADRVAKLRRVTIYVDYDHKLKAMQYHPSAGWLRKHGHDPAMAKCVHITTAKRLKSMFSTNRQPWVILHELSHAYHDQVLGFDYPPILKAYERIKASGKYEKVLQIWGRKTRHYALSNHKEFFAELTESYFGVNDFHPFVYAELKEFDPETFRLLEEIWGKRR